MRFHQLEHIIDTHNPDFIGIQETKVDDENFPREDIENLGYHVEFFGQKTHYGVALLTKFPFKKCQKGFPNDAQDAQRRFIAGDFELENGKTITVMNGYFPQGESRTHLTKFPNKQKYYENLYQYINENYTKSDSLVVMGDVNVCPADIDIGIGDDNKKRWLKSEKCSFLPEEQQWLSQLMDWGLVDSYRQIHPDVHDKYSWFDYRSKGFDREPKRGLRIDLILATEALSQNCADAGIDYDARAMEKPSDHCPIWAEYT